MSFFLLLYLCFFFCETRKGGRIKGTVTKTSLDMALVSVRPIVNSQQDCSVGLWMSFLFLSCLLFLHLFICLPVISFSLSFSLVLLTYLLLFLPFLLVFWLKDVMLWLWSWRLGAVSFGYGPLRDFMGFLGSVFPPFVTVCPSSHPATMLAS